MRSKKTEEHVVWCLSQSNRIFSFSSVDFPTVSKCLQWVTMKTTTTKTLVPEKCQILKKFQKNNKYD